LAYLDADWVPPGGGPVATLVVFPDGSAQWHDDEPRPGDASADPDFVAASLLVAVASAAVRAVADAAPVDVIGTGLIAHAVRHFLDNRVATAGDATPPGAVIEATGDPASIVAATRRLADRGVLVLAGEPAGRRLDVDLYTDVHRRGLEIVGVGRPGGDENEMVTGPFGAPPPAPVEFGALVANTARWYRLSATS
jgi:hypothetical protein